METRVWLNLLNSDLSLGGVLEGDIGGSITASASRAVAEVGTLSGVYNADVDWTRTLIQPWREVNGVAWPLGVYVPNVPHHSYGPVNMSADIQVSDRTLLLQRALYGGEYSLPAGSDVLQAVQWLITWAGLSVGMITDPIGTTRSDLTWEAGTSVLTIINQLLSWQGYRGVRCTPQGHYVTRAAMRAAVSPVVAEFSSGSPYSYTSTWEYEQDLSEIPNVVDVWVQGDQDNPPIHATAVNSDPNDSLSLANRSRVSYFQKSEASTLAEAQALAEVVLEERRMAETRINIEHTWMRISPGDVIRFSSVRGGLGGLWVVSEVTKPLDTLTLQTMQAGKVS